MGHATKDRTNDLNPSEFPPTIFEDYYINRQKLDAFLEAYFPDQYKQCDLKVGSEF
jgi:hypothetical protein